MSQFHIFQHFQYSCFHPEIYFPLLFATHKVVGVEIAWVNWCIIIHLWEKQHHCKNINKHMWLDLITNADAIFSTFVQGQKTVNL